MTSLLKRKRGEVEVVDSPPPKNPDEKSPHPLAILDHPVGWDAAFVGLEKAKELIKTNGIKADDVESEKEGSPESVDFETFIQGAESKRKRAARKAEENGEEIHKDAARKEAVWTISEPIGGRNINVDPVFSADGSFIILANRSSILVYSTSNSLLTRTLKLDFSIRPGARIITYCLSPSDPNLLWVACSDGVIYCLDWTTGAGVDSSWAISSTGCIHMTVASMESVGRRRDVVFTTEMKKDGGWRITANELNQPNGPIPTAVRTIYTSKEKINFLQTAAEGSVIVAASGNKILLGNLRSVEYDTTDKIKYEFRIFESQDAIMSLDLRAAHKSKSGGHASKKVPIPVVDLVVGNVRGSIFIHNDLLGNLIRSQDGSVTHKINLAPRKFHWHRKAVHTVKWSLDGNYIISGGTETVLILWQLDTGHQQFLPHMGATIQKVVISPSGSSYGIQLADNSTIVISTAELEATAHIAGVQANVLQYEEPIESIVLRVGEEPSKYPLIQRTPAVVNPSDPTRLLLAVGQHQEINPHKPILPTSQWLQTFDLGTGHNLSRQALTRTVVTHINTAPNAHMISEPRTTHIQISSDGLWLATIDEWLPPARDLDYLARKPRDLESERLSKREVYLKFWQWSPITTSWELVSRVNSPHSSADNLGNAGHVLSLAVDPSSLRFSTIGEDSIVRTWTTKTRKRDGVVVKDKNGKAFRNWTCESAIYLYTPELSDDAPFSVPINGSVAFSPDGSVLAAAHGKDSLLHLLDPETGTIRLSLTGLFEGEIISLAFLSSNLIILSNKLTIYDLVRAETRYSVKLSATTSSLSLAQKSEMMHLAVDPQSETFALALPGRITAPTVEEIRTQSLLAQYSELAVFSVTKREPMVRQTFGTIITALLPAMATEGFLVLDTLAEIRTVVKKGVQPITALAQSTSSLHLDDPVIEDEEEEVAMINDNEGDEEEAEDEIQPLTPGDEEDADVDDDEKPVVTAQQLKGIFDVGPAFALPPVEEMFYQVAGLFAEKPLVGGV